MPFRHNIDRFRRFLSRRTEEGAPERSTTARGFTIIELMVSIFIIMIISVSVVTDLNRTRYQEELQESARTLAASLHDMQARALAASSVRTCIGSGNVKYVCEQTQVGCTNACAALLPPSDFGLTLNGNATSVNRFAEVEPTYNNRREVGVGGDEHEQLGQLVFLQNVKGSNYVTMGSPFVTNVGSVGSITVTFERQSGTMRINACDKPIPYVQSCFGIPEPITVKIVLSHSKLPGITRTISLNAITGRISLE